MLTLRRLCFIVVKHILVAAFQHFDVFTYKIPTTQSPLTIYLILTQFMHLEQMIFENIMEDGLFAP